MLLHFETPMRYSIIIVTFNSEEYIEKCIDSIIYNKPSNSYEIIVFDNNSSDNTVSKIIGMNNKNIRLLRNRTNIGFSKACNLSVNECNGEYIAFCNPDVVVKGRVFDKASEILPKNSEIACYAPTFVNSTGKKVCSTYNFPDHHNYSLFKSIIEKTLYPSTAFKLYSKFDFGRIDWVSGAFFIIPKKIFLEIGKFDENFFLNYEEIDLFWKLKKVGLSIYYDKDINIIHFEGRSKITLSSLKLLATRIKSEYYYVKKRRLET